MNYPHWRDLSPTDQEQSIPLSFHFGDLPSIKPLPSIRSQKDMERRRHIRKAPEDRRKYASHYIGVTVQAGRYVGQWRKPNGVYARGPHRDTQEEAARDRARALGKSELEVRQ